jgi:hypothetical protein
MKEKKKKGVQKFNSSALSLKKLEERKEMLVLWRRGEGFFPKQQL